MLRFDQVLGATADYLHHNYRLDDLSAFALQNRGLLPSDWAGQAENVPYHGLIDYFVGELHPDHVGIVIMGSYPALLPLAERYQHIAHIEYPVPREWSPTARYRSDVATKYMLFEFDRASLMRAAADLLQAPPPEIWTRFPGSS